MDLVEQYKKGSLVFSHSLCLRCSNESTAAKNLPSRQTLLNLTSTQHQHHVKGEKLTFLIYVKKLLCCVLLDIITWSLSHMIVCTNFYNFVAGYSRAIRWGSRSRRRWFCVCPRKERLCQGWTLDSRSHSHRSWSWWEFLDKLMWRQASTKTVFIINIFQSKSKTSN